MTLRLPGLIIIGTALLASTPAAFADHKPGRAHAQQGHAYAHHHAYRGHMPRWLKRHDRFRGWYRHSHLRRNPYLDWGELYSIFVWERRYSNQRRFHRYGDHEHRRYSYYREYWDGGHRRYKKHRDGKRYRDDRKYGDGRKYRDDREYRDGKRRRSHRH